MPDYMNLFNAMSQTGEMFQNRRDRENKPPFEWEISSGKDGGPPEASVKTDAETAMNIRKALENYGQIMASMQQEVGRIQAQEERQRQGLGPLMSVLSTVSGELAQDRRLPPVVSALGRANLALNPPPQALADRRLGILQAMGGMGAQQAQIGLEAQRLGAQMKEQELRRQELIKSKQDAFLTHEMDKANIQQFDAKAFMTAARRQGFTADEAMLHAQELTAAQEQAKIRELVKGKEETERAVGRAIEVAKAEAPIREAAARRTAKFTSGLTLSREKQMAEIRQGYRKEIMDKATQNKKDLAQTNLDTRDKAQIQAVDRLGSQVRRVEAVLRQHPEYVNPLEGNVVIGKFKKMSDSERQFLYSVFRDMTATVVQMSGEQTRGFTRYGLEFNKELVPKPTDTLSEVAGKLKQLQMERQQRFEGIRKVYPKADIEAFNPEGGHDDRTKALMQILSEPD